MKNKYDENYNGRLAETVTEIFFKKHNYIVSKYGVENNIHFEFIKNKISDNQDTKEVLSKIMTMPDFVIMDLNSQNEINQVYLVEVKYRTFKSYNEFKFSLEKYGDIYKQAEKYRELWDGKIHIFLIANIDNKITTYYDSANRIVDQKFIRRLDKNNHIWIDKTILQEYNTYSERIFKNR